MRRKGVVREVNRRSFRVCRILAFFLFFYSNGFSRNIVFDEFRLLFEGRDRFFFERGFFEEFLFLFWR